MLFLTFYKGQVSIVQHRELCGLFCAFDAPAAPFSFIH